VYAKEVAEDRVKAINNDSDEITPYQADKQVSGGNILWMQKLLWNGCNLKSGWQHVGIAPTFQPVTKAGNRSFLFVYLSGRDDL
jgi:hypothetical protein